MRSLNWVLKPLSLKFNKTQILIHHKNWPQGEVIICVKFLTMVIFKSWQGFHLIFQCCAHLFKVWIWYLFGMLYNEMFLFVKINLTMHCKVAQPNRKHIQIPLTLNALRIMLCLYKNIAKSSIQFKLYIESVIKSTSVALPMNSKEHFDKWHPI